MKPLCFKIDEELLHELKVHVAARGQSMQEFMNTLIRQTLTSPEKQLQDITQVRAEIDQMRTRIKELDAALRKEQKRIEAASASSDE